MRVDKFLWCVRVYKTRTISTEAIKNNRVSVNEQLVKSSKELKIGDKISIKKNQICILIEIIQIPKNRVGNKDVTLYIIDKTDVSEYEKLKQINEMQKYYRQKGLGRPTKKDRRELDDFLVDEEFDFEDLD